jgi:hypothetical protein
MQTLNLKTDNCPERYLDAWVSTHERKPLGGKSYGHIPHLPGSRVGPGDHKCSEGQARIATVKKRDKYDTIICQEKVDGSNVGIAKIDGCIVPLTRSGYIANTSRFEQHTFFHNWVLGQINRFDELLNEGERLCGEWLAQAHGTRYNLLHEPFVGFDLMRGDERALLAEMNERLPKFGIIQPTLLHIGEPFSIENMLIAIKISGHGAIDPVEGAVWRVERNRLKDRHSGERIMIVDYLVKYVRPEKKDGIYLPEQSGNDAVWNWKPVC